MRVTAFRPLSTLVIVFMAIPAHAGGAQGPRRVAPALEVTEASIAELQDRLRRGHVSCHALVQAYRDRIAAYDSTGPSLHSIVALNPAAIGQADSLDAEFARDRRMGPLHCVATIVVDDVETAAMPTTAGSPALARFNSGRDATTVRRIQQAGGIVLAKSGMMEFALTPDEGTARAVGASFATVGLGAATVTRSALVSIRATPGLMSRAGTVPLTSNDDAVGPVGRSVADAVALLQVVAGADPSDSLTAAAGKRAPDYLAFLRRDGLAGKRIGVPRETSERMSADTVTARLFLAALAEMRRRGAVIVDRVELPGTTSSPPGCNRFRFDLERWLAEQGDRAPVHRLTEVIGTRPLLQSVRARLEAAQVESLPPARNADCAARAELGARRRAAITATMDSLKLDALASPSPADDAGDPLPNVGLPAIRMPMGYARRGSGPAGIQLVGREWAEPTLIAMAYGYEQATHHRRPPASTPPLRGRR